VGDEAQEGARDYLKNMSARLAIASIIGAVRTLTVDPKAALQNWMGLPFYLKNALHWRRLNAEPAFRIRMGEFKYCAADRFRAAGAVDIHYFNQDIWAAGSIYARRVATHVDVGSRLDGFISHLLPFCAVQYIDLRPLQLRHRNLTFVQGTVLELPFPSDSIPSLSCLHVIEHIGLGRYGDEVDPLGHVKAARELVRVLAPGGVLLIGTPVGNERLVYDAHRVFDPGTIAKIFAPCELLEFNLIADDTNAIKEGATFAEARNCRYGCGLFMFRKPSAVAAGS
jgi:SAM-dependent methyltransferase